MHSLKVIKSKFSAKPLVEYNLDNITMISSDALMILFRWILLCTMLFLFITWLASSMIHVSLLYSSLAIFCVFLCACSFDSTWKFYEDGLLIESFFLGKKIKLNSFEVSHGSKLLITRAGFSPGHGAQASLGYLPVLELRPSFQEINLGSKNLSASYNINNLNKLHELFTHCKKIAQFLNVPVEIDSYLLSPHGVSSIAHDVFRDGYISKDM